MDVDEIKLNILIGIFFTDILNPTVKIIYAMCQGRQATLVSPIQYLNKFEI